MRGFVFMCATALRARAPGQKRSFCFRMRDRRIRRSAPRTRRLRSLKPFGFNARFTRYFHFGKTPVFPTPFPSSIFFRPLITKMNPEKDSFSS